MANFIQKYRNQFIFYGVLAAICGSAVTYYQTHKKIDKPKAYAYDEKDVNSDGNKDLVIRNPKDGKILKVLLGTSQKDTYREDISLTYRLQAQEDSLESKLKENKNDTR